MTDTETSASSTRTTWWATLATGTAFGLVVWLPFQTPVAALLYTLAQYFFTSPQFWTSTIDLVKYIRDVQEIPGARDLWSISALGHFGVGEVATFARAIGTFAHPVGTGHYFAVPLSLSVSYLLSRAYGSRVGAANVKQKQDHRDGVKQDHLETVWIWDS